VLGSAVLALVPLVLAAIVFGNAFRASERDRADGRLAAAVAEVRTDVAAAETAAAAAARTLARSRDAQLALLRRDDAALAALSSRRGPAALTVTTATGATPEPPAGTPRQVFAHTCGMCHALADAGSAGVTGPDLDELRPTAAQVRRKVRVGSLDGVMQPNLLRGAQARAVARYVARAARG